MQYYKIYILFLDANLSLRKLVHPKCSESERTNVNLVGKLSSDYEKSYD